MKNVLTQKWKSFPLETYRGLGGGLLAMPPFPYVFFYVEISKITFQSHTFPLY